LIQPVAPGINSFGSGGHNPRKRKKLNAGPYGLALAGRERTGGPAAHKEVMSMIKNAVSAGAV